MESKSLKEILIDLHDKSLMVEKKLDEIKTIDNSNFDMNYDNIQKLVKISNNLSNLNDNLDDLRLKMLDRNNINYLTAEQQEDLREYRFQKVLEKTFYPYILYLRLCMNVDN